MRTESRHTSCWAVERSEQAETKRKTRSRGLESCCTLVEPLGEAAATFVFSFIDFTCVGHSQQNANSCSLGTRKQFVQSSPDLRISCSLKKNHGLNDLDMQDPQVITGSHDSTIMLWDLRYGKTMATLTHHKNSVQAMAPHPTEDVFVSASAENIKKFKLPNESLMHNMLSRQKTIINSAPVNEEGVIVKAGSNGSLWFWVWTSRHNFRQSQIIVQPDYLHFCPRLHHLFCYICQEKCQRFSCPSIGSPSHRICGVLGSLGNDPKNSNRHQPIKEHWCSDHKQQRRGMG